MGVPIPEMVPVDNSSAEALLSPLEGMSGAERRKHASIFNYWLSIRGDRQFPAIRDLDPLEISDAGPWSVLLEMIGAGENAVIRHLGQAIKLGVDAETIARAPASSLLACIHGQLPLVATAMQVIAFESSFEADGNAIRCWVTLLPFSATGVSIDYVYGFVSLDRGEEAQTEPEQVEELEPDQVPLGPVDDEPIAAGGSEPADDATENAAPPSEPEDELDAESELAGEVETEQGADPIAELEASDPDLEPLPEIEPEPAPVAAFEPEPDSEPEFGPEPDEALELSSDLELEQACDEDAPEARAGFSAKLMESVSGFYGRVVHAAPDAAVEIEPAEEWSAPGDAPAEADVTEVYSEPTHSMEGSLQSKLSEVRAMAEEARQAQLRSQLALLAGLSAAYDFALDAESEPEEYLRLVEGQGLKIQLRAPMKPVVKLAFAETCDDATIAQLEAVLAWALKQDLPRGSLVDRIESEGGIGSVLEGLGKAA